MKNREKCGIIIIVDDVWQGIVAQMNIVDCGHPYRANCHSQSLGAYFIPKRANMRINAVRIIKDNMTMNRILEQYGYTADRKGFICCPFHTEKTPSMRIYEKDYHCFGCQEHGDVITFVQKLFGLSFQDALRKIDADFGLNIYGDHSFEELRRSHYQQRALQAKREREQNEKQRLEDEYWAAFDEWKRLDENRRLYKPKTFTAELHPLFVESLQWLEHQKQLLYDIEDRRREYERTSHFLYGNF